MCGCNHLTPRLSVATRSSSGSLAKFTAIRRASSRVSRLVAERCDAAICPDWGRSGSARLALETTLMTPNRPRRRLSISPGSNSRPFLLMISSARGKGVPEHRGRNAAAYAVSEIPRLRGVPIMPGGPRWNIICIRHTDEAPSVKVIALPATPPLPPKKSCRR